MFRVQLNNDSNNYWTSDTLNANKLMLNSPSPVPNIHQIAISTSYSGPHLALTIGRGSNMTKHLNNNNNNQNAYNNNFANRSYDKGFSSTRFDDGTAFLHSQRRATPSQNASFDHHTPGTPPVNQPGSGLMYRSPSAQNNPYYHQNYHQNQTKLPPPPSFLQSKTQSPYSVLCRGKSVKQNFQTSCNTTPMTTPPSTKTASIPTTNKTNMIRMPVVTNTSDVMSNQQANYMFLTKMARNEAVANVNLFRQKIEANTRPPPPPQKSAVAAVSSITNSKKFANQSIDDEEEEEEEEKKEEITKTDSRNSTDDDQKETAIDGEIDDVVFYLNNKNILSEEAMKRIKRNQDCLAVLTEGDIIEYVKNESDLDDRDNNRMWAIYMGKSALIRYCAETHSIVSEPYWRIATKYLIYINKDMDKRLFTLPIFEVLNRARRAFTNTEFYAKFFSSDRNFATWCRFDINKSDIEFAIHVDNHTQSKEFVMRRFMSSIEHELIKMLNLKETSIF